MNPLGPNSPSTYARIGQGFVQLAKDVRDLFKGAYNAMARWLAGAPAEAGRATPLTQRSPAGETPQQDPRRQGAVQGSGPRDTKISTPLSEAAATMPDMTSNVNNTLAEATTALSKWLNERNEQGESGLARLLGGEELRASMRKANNEGGLAAVRQVLTQGSDCVMYHLVDSAFRQEKSMYIGKAFEALLADACSDLPSRAGRGLRKELEASLAPPRDQRAQEASRSDEIGSAAFERSGSRVSEGDDDAVNWNETVRSGDAPATERQQD